MPKETREDREYRKQFEESLKVNKDAILSNLAAQQAGVPVVPPSGDPIDEPPLPTSGEHLDATTIHSNPQSLDRLREKHPMFSMDTRVNDRMFKAAASAVGVEGVESLSSGENTEPITKYGATATPSVHISRKQYIACQKFPALVEFLGSEAGEKIARNIASDINQMMVESLEKNAQAIDPCAKDCIADRQNIKQFFKDKSWECKVVASGPFRGDEAICYDKDQDLSFIVRKTGDQYDNVSSQFNMIHEFETVEAEVTEEIPKPPPLEPEMILESELKNVDVGEEE